MRKKKCKHTTVTYTWLDTRTSTPVSKHCSPKFGCGATLSLGPSNDEPSAVQMEMRAVVLEQDSHAWHGKCPGTATTFEQWGWLSHIDTTSVGVLSGDEVAGYLARELATYDDRETRDADAWPWDPSRAVGPQYEEWVEEMRDFRDNGNGEPAPFPDSRPVTTATISSLAEDVQAAGGALPYGGCEPVASGDPIADLIAASSIGAGLINLMANGIEAELADLQDEMDEGTRPGGPPDPAAVTECLAGMRATPLFGATNADGDPVDLDPTSFPSSPVNADGDPTEWASARNRAAAVVEDALRPKPSWTCVQRTVDVDGADVGVAADEWPTPIVETDGAE